MPLPKFPKPTPEQINLLGTYQDKWRAIATQTSRVNPSQVTPLIQQLYQRLELPRPTLEFVASPYAATVKLKRLIEEQRYKPLTPLYKQVRQQLLYTLTTQLSGYSTTIHTYPVGLKESPDAPLRRELEMQLHRLLNQAIRQHRADGPEDFTAFQYQQWWPIAPEAWAGHACYIDWIGNCLGCDHDAEAWALLEGLLQHCGRIYAYEEICLVCDRPQHLSLDENRKLHAIAEPALAFSDGLRLFAHHGQWLPEHYGKVSPAQWQPDGYQRTKDAPVRKLLLQHLSPQELSEDWLLWEVDVVLRQQLAHKLGAQHNSLSPKQQRLIPAYRQKWRAIALQRSPINREKVTQVVKAFYRANQLRRNPEDLEILFAQGFSSAGKLIKRNCRGQRRVWPTWAVYGQHDGRRSIYRGNFSYSKLLNQFWRPLAAQLGDEAFLTLKQELICDRTWSLTHLPGWVQPERSTPWLSLFDFCIEVLGCVHDAEAWSLLKAVAMECGWFYPGYKTCVMCDRPIKISVDDQDRLHDEKEAALVFADGYRLRAIHGQPLKKRGPKIGPKGWGVVR